MDDAHAEYLRAIEERFVALRGRGMLLSPRDLALVRRWQKESVPLRIVLRALEEGVSAFIDRNASGMPLPSSLAYFESKVDKAALLWRERTMSWGVSQAEGGLAPQGVERGVLLDAAMEAVRLAGEESQSDAIKSVLRETWRSLRQAADQSEEEVWALIARLDGAMVEAAEETIDPETLIQWRDDVKDSITRRSGLSMSPEARSQKERVALHAKVRQRLGLPDLVEVLNHVGV